VRSHSSTPLLPDSVWYPLDRYLGSTGRLSVLLPGIKIIQFLACFVTVFTCNYVLYNTAAQPHYLGFKSCGMSHTVLHCKTNSLCMAWHRNEGALDLPEAPLTLRHSVTPKKTWILSNITMRISNLTDTLFFNIVVCLIKIYVCSGNWCNCIQLYNQSYTPIYYTVQLYLWATLCPEV
jgi:hypothetical protein